MLPNTDRADTLQIDYNVCLKCRQYYKYIFWLLLDLAITNSYILYHSQPDLGRVKLKDFQVSLANELINIHSAAEREWVILGLLPLGGSARHTSL